MALAFWGVPLRTFANAFSHLDARFLLPIALLFFVQEGIRAFRQLLLLRPVAPNMRFGSSLSIFFISFFCIHLFPARLGEIVRPYLLLRKEKIPLGAGLGMVVAERSIDMLASLLMFLIVLLWVDVPGTISLAGREVDLAHTVHYAGFVLAPLLVAFILALLFMKKQILSIVHRVAAWLARILPGLRFRQTAAQLPQFVETFTEGFASFRSLRYVGAILVLTTLTWTTTALMYTMMASAFGMETLIGIGESLGVMVITMWASILPSPPAMAGVQEASGRGALALFGIKGPEWQGLGLAYAVTIHWGQVFLQSLGALYFLARENIGMRELVSQVRQPEADPGRPVNDTEQMP